MEETMYQTPTPAEQARQDAMFERGRRMEERLAEVNRQQEIAAGTTTDAGLTGDLVGPIVMDAIIVQMDGVDENTQQVICDEYEQALADAAWEHRVRWDVTRSMATYPAHSDVSPEEVCARAVESVDAWEIIARHVTD